MVGIETLRQIEIDEVPTCVWDDVYEKWRKAYLDGWDYWKLWRGCSLCQWQQDREYRCRQCPLGIDNWCKSYGRDSRISIQFWDADDHVHVDNEDKWRVEILEFLRFLVPYCSEDINEVVYE